MARSDPVPECAPPRVTGVTERDAWLVASRRHADGALWIVPECRAGHAYVSAREADRYTVAWRGDVWLACDCRRCGEAYVAYCSTGALPVVHCWAVTRAELAELLRTPADATIADVLLGLGVARWAATSADAAEATRSPGQVSPGRARFLARAR